jgi:RNA polymerase sigma-70 factor (ECF subfamily)
VAETPSFDELIERLRRQDEAAATQVYDRFGRRLIALARGHLDGRLRPKLDPEDVVQSVFQTVFRRLADGQFDLGGWDGLWGLMTRITVRKCGRWREYFHAASRDVEKEVARPGGADDSGSGWQFIDREPTAAEALVLAETVEQVLHGLNDREQRITALSLDGVAVSEISRRVGCTESKVYRVLRHVRGRLERMQEQPTA